MSAAVGADANRFWYPVMNHWSDQTGIAHRIAADGPERPACGARLTRVTLGGGFHAAEDANCRECRRCQRAK